MCHIIMERRQKWRTVRRFKPRSAKLASNCQMEDVEADNVEDDAVRPRCSLLRAARKRLGAADLSAKVETDDPHEAGGPRAWGAFNTEDLIVPSAM